MRGLSNLCFYVQSEPCYSFCFFKSFFLRVICFLPGCMWVVRGLLSFLVNLASLFCWTVLRSLVHCARLVSLIPCFLMASVRIRRLLVPYRSSLLFVILGIVLLHRNRRTRRCHVKTQRIREITFFVIPAVWLYFQNYNYAVDKFVPYDLQSSRKRFIIFCFRIHLLFSRGK